jgi:4-amino-4-deoxy-L-arabinose transferase-like glycosyltransferase
LLLLTVVVLLPAAPVLYHTPDTDSSIFLFIGNKILHGQFPFRDWYDHKPPLIFYINALGLWLGGGSRWGVWFLELVSLASASLFGYAFLRRFYGRLAATLAVGITLLNLGFVHQRGNLTEEYALPFQFGVIFLLGGIDQVKKTRWRLIAIGCLLAMASSVKQPMAGIGLAVFAYLLIQHACREGDLRSGSVLLKGLRDLLFDCLWMGLGFVLVWSLWFIYFAAVGIFPDFWEAAFAYNVALSGITPEKRIRALFASFAQWFRWSSYFQAGMLAWLAALPSLLIADARFHKALASRLMALLFGLGGLALGGFGLLRHSPLAWGGLVALLLAGLILSGLAERWIFSRWKAIQLSERSDLYLPLLIAVVDLPVAVAFSSLSGNNFAHYFMALLPSLTLLNAFLIHSLLRVFGRAQGRQLAYLWLFVLLVPLSGPGIAETEKLISPRRDPQLEAAVAYVAEHTQPGDFVLQWGFVPQVNLLTGRDAPTRYFFTDPLFVDGYSGRTQTGELLRDLQARPPVLIVDQKIPRLPLIQPRDPGQCDTVKDPQLYVELIKKAKQRKDYDPPHMPEGMDEVYRWICENYTPVGPVGEEGWQMYRLKGK